MSQSGILTQGDPASQNLVFNCYRYSINYPGFSGQTLTQQGYIESGSTFTCDLYPTGIKEIDSETGISVYPNPFYHQITMEGDETELKDIRVYNILGQNVTSQTSKLRIDDAKLIIDLSQLNSGFYFINTKTIAYKVFKL